MQAFSTLEQAKLLTPQQVSLRLNMSRSFIYQELAAGRLEHYQFGKVKGSIRISERQLMDYLNTFRKSRQSYTPEKIDVQAPPSLLAMSRSLNKLLSR